MQAPWWLVAGGFGLGVYVLMKSNTKAPSGGIGAFANAIGGAEGFGTPGAIPTVRNNPGDIEDSTGTIRTFATVADGWQELYRELALIPAGSAALYGYTPDMTIADFAARWTQTEVSAWTANVVAFLNQQGYPVTADTPVSQVLNA